MAEVLKSGRKHFGKKEKLLVTSNFFFTHSVFKSLVLQTRKKQGLFGNGLKESVIRLSKFYVFDTNG